MFTSHPPPPAALDGRDLVLRYGKTPVVHGVSLSLEPGRATALVGPNGSGKSTLLRSLARLHRVDDGTVTLGGGGDEDGGPGRSVSLLSAREFAREVTLFSQSRPAPQGLTVAEVVAFGRHPYRRGFSGLSAEDRTAIAYAMDATGVRDMAARPAGELSGGEMQRVWLAACLAQNTGVVLLDEPTNHLDLRYQIETLDLVRDLVQDHGIAVGIVLHDLDHAARVADTLVLMRAGRVHAAGPPADVLTAQNIGEVYDIRVEAYADPRTGRVRIDPVGRHPAPTTSAGNSRSSNREEDPS
ncbi:MULTISPECIES: ABC transporter ATP-binding protein [unclassified Streptomyces]|uniref:ABC transporter ATP-binding protein n=1 Tax=unclassified Streptomyces TaxID=2593676 RepID=UPI00081F49A4|nr:MULTISPECIES: ABC transporter ATP-binding protein [unclassified Streptomyces]MYR98020.1 ATP-binding cassette domain-containing protein [Streptomyces sp. SID4937]SCE32969.1 iron complex transport system ATP-binding protein [Streptomyces sp. ScaeMP-e83]